MLRMTDRGQMTGSSAATIPGKLLLVDDNVEDLLRYSALLRHQGHVVRSVATYAEGCVWLDCDAFDLVIVSQGSCNFEGRAVLIRALERDRHTPVLVLAGVANMPAYIEAMQIGAFDYLEKPLSPLDLAELVDKHLRRRDSGSVAA
jgi:DNA-binding NtrC family response regulator